MTRTEKTTLALRQIAEKNGEHAISPRVPLPVAEQCQFLGDVISGQPCSIQIFHCNKHHNITTRFLRCDNADRHCATCKDFLSNQPKTEVEYRQAADNYARAIIPYPHGVYSGRGVVIVGGGKYWPSAYVSARMLRHVGCALPIQIWYIGTQERDVRYERLLAPLGVESINALAHPAVAKTRGLTGFPDRMRKNGRHPPFQVKSFAVLHSPFEEVLYLDADCYPCADPTSLFDEPRYIETGGVFWPDMAHTNKWTKWEQWGIEPFPPDAGWEVGQYAIHKRIAWRQLNLTRWYDNHGDYYYGWGKVFEHGDKLWRVAWAKYRTAPAFFTTACEWKGVAFVHPGADGSPLFAHRCRSKFTIEHTSFSSTPQNGDNLRANLPLEEEAFGYLEELRKALV